MLTLRVWRSCMPNWKFKKPDVLVDSYIVDITSQNWHLKSAAVLIWFLEQNVFFSVDKVKVVNVNVNVNLYSASSQKAPLMRSMCRVLIKKTCLQCTTKTVNLHVRLTQIVLEQVPCRWSSDSEGATAVGIELKPCRSDLGHGYIHRYLYVKESLKDTV